jgi:anaerobic selenocysteine-containing dehydrogenase
VAIVGESVRSRNGAGAAGKPGSTSIEPLPGTDLALANGLLHIAIREGLIDVDYIGSRTTGFDAICIPSRFPRRSWNCGWHETGRNGHKGNHNSKIAEGWEGF